MKPVKQADLFLTFFLNLCCGLLTQLPHVDDYSTIACNWFITGSPSTSCLPDNISAGIFYPEKKLSQENAPDS